MPEQEQPKEKKTTVANDESKRWRGGKGPEARIEERVNACYSYILEGGTRRQITESFRLASERRFAPQIPTTQKQWFFSKRNKLPQEKIF